MEQVYVETDCTFTFNSGCTVESGGSVVTPDRVIAYLGANGILTNWHGHKLGTYEVTSTWNTPGSYVSSTQCQVYARVNGVLYTGRSAGLNMLFRGKRVKNQ